MMRKSISFSTALALVAILSVSACGKSDKDAKGADAKKTEASEKKAKGRTPQAVSVAPVEGKDFSGRIVVAGQVQAMNEARVFPTASGARVLQILADAGDRVNAGQALARLDARQISADSELLAAQVRRARTALAEAEVGLTSARQNLARTESGPRESALDITNAQIAYDQANAEYQRALAVTGDGALSEEQIAARRAAAQIAEARLRSQRGDINAFLDARRQAVAQAVARVGAARADLSVSIAQQTQSNSRQNNGLITAPVSGLVIARNVNVGEIAGAGGQPMFTIVTNGALELAAEVAESEISRLTPSMEATFVAPNGTQVRGVLRRMPAQIDPQRRTGIARFSLDPNESVRSGVFLSGTATSNARGVSAVPASALVYGREGASIFVLRQDNSVTKIPVRIGGREGQLVELLEGPARGSLVVTAGSAFLAEGEVVNPIRTVVKPAAAPAAPAPAKK